MTDPRRPEDTDEFEAADAAADRTAEAELGATEAADDDPAADEQPGADEELVADAELGADADLDADGDGLDADELETKVLPTAAAGATGAAGAATVRPQASRETLGRAGTGAALDELPYVDDRVSKVWVALIAATFAAIFIYGLLLGRGGILTGASPSPEPTASPLPSASPSVLATPTIGASVTPGSSIPASPAGSAPRTAAPSQTGPASTSPGPT